MAPACSAWWAISAAPRSPFAFSSSSAAACSSRRRNGDIASLTARRASSWRNASAPARAFQHAAPQARLDAGVVGVVGDAAQDLLVDLAREDRGALQRPPRIGPSRAARISVIAWIVGGTPALSASRYSVTWNGLPAAGGIDVAGLAAPPGRQHRHRLGRERRELDPLAGVARQVGPQRGEAVPGIRLVVAKADQHHHARRADPPPEEAQGVQRRVVGPVDVLQRQQRRALAAVSSRSSPSNVAS
jgi:hypothetical protein